jgi:hypothetical protein
VGRDSSESKYMDTELPHEDDCQPINSRYDGQIAVFGAKFQQKINEQRQFLVGSGAIGCETLARNKNCRFRLLFSIVSKSVTWITP